MLFGCCGRCADGLIELSLTVPITNSLAFLFTVLGEWWAEGKTISRGETTQHVDINSLKLMCKCRYVDRNGTCVGRHCSMCPIEDGILMIMLLQPAIVDFLRRSAPFCMDAPPPSSVQILKSVKVPRPLVSYLFLSSCVLGSIWTVSETEQLRNSPNLSMMDDERSDWHHGERC